MFIGHVVICWANGWGEGRVGRLWHSDDQKSARTQSHFESSLHVSKSLNTIVIHKLSRDVLNYLRWQAHWSTKWVIGRKNTPGKCSSEVFFESVPKYVFRSGQNRPQLENTSNITSSGIFPCFSSQACKSLGVNWASAFFKEMTLNIKVQVKRVRDRDSFVQHHWKICSTEKFCSSRNASQIQGSIIKKASSYNLCAKWDIKLH